MGDGVMVSTVLVGVGVAVGVGVEVGVGEGDTYQLSLRTRGRLTEPPAFVRSRAGISSRPGAFIPAGEAIAWVEAGVAAVSGLINFAVAGVENSKITMLKLPRKNLIKLGFIYPPFMILGYPIGAYQLCGNVQCTHFYNKYNPILVI